MEKNKQQWNPEIENDNDDDILAQDQQEYLEVCEGYGDYLIAQLKAGVFNKEK